MRLLLSIVALIALPAYAGQVYRWVDATGHVHYDDRPRQVDATAVRTTSAPETDTTGEARRTQMQRLLASYAEDRRQQEEREQHERREQEQRSANCALAREQVTGLTTAGRIYEVNTQGVRHYLGERERSEALARARDAVSHWCQ
jgi:hypothetical protein